MYSDLNFLGILAVVGYISRHAVLPLWKILSGKRIKKKLLRMLNNAHIHIYIILECLFWYLVQLSTIHCTYEPLCTMYFCLYSYVLSYSANLSCISLRNFKMACIKCTVLSVKLYMIVHVCTNMYFLFCCTWLSSACKLYVLSV